MHREPSKLRTIFGSNADSKFISGTFGYKLVPGMLDVTPSMQRGFCRGRQLAHNIVDLDSYMRVFNAAWNPGARRSSISDMLISALYDFCNAFPTLVREWLFLVLTGLGIPEAYFNVIWWLYQQIQAFSSGAGNGSFLFDMLCGVKTGCPLSSICFVLGINPIVELFAWLSDGPKLSVTRVCADDFGAALKALKWLKVQASIFRSAKRVTGLCLKDVKCVLIVSCCELTSDLRQQVRQWLSTMSLILLSLK